MLRRLFTSKRAEPFSSAHVCQAPRRGVRADFPATRRTTLFAERVWPGRSKEVWIYLCICVQTLPRNCLCPHSVSSALSFFHQNSSDREFFRLRTLSKTMLNASVWRLKRRENISFIRESFPNRRVYVRNTLKKCANSTVERISIQFDDRHLAPEGF